MGLCLSKTSVRSPVRESAHEAPSSRAPTTRSTSPEASPGRASDAGLPLSPRGAQSPAPSDIPPRPRSKISALAETTQRAAAASVDAGLIAYATEALEQIEWQPPDVALSLLDRKHLAALIAECNRRHPGLSAVAFDTPQAFLNQLKRQDNPAAWRGLLQVGPPSLHRIAVDVRHHADGSSSVLLVDASKALDRKSYPEVFLRGYKPLMAKLGSDFEGRCRFAVIEADAQKSLAGCTIYSISHALELHRHQALFDGLHGRLTAEGRCLPQGHPASEAVRDTELVDGRAILPPSFYKHAHSRGTVAQVASRQGLAAEQQNVSTGSGQPETIGQRVRDFRVEREDPDEDEGTLSYSMSIETARLTKIRHALESAIGEAQDGAG